WQAPDVHARRMRNDNDSEFRRGFRMADAVRLVHGEHGAPDMRADLERRLQREIAELAGGELGAILAPNRDGLSSQVASMRTMSLHDHGQLGPGIDLARRDLNRAAVLTMRDCLRGHDRQAVGSCAAWVPAI